MIASAEPQTPHVAGFRTKLLLAMMLVVTAVTLLALYLAEQSLAGNVSDDLQHAFAADVAALHNAREVRQAGLVERCRTLVRKPRIHAALLDDALDLLYPNAEDELRDVMAQPGEPAAADVRFKGLRAQFYRFLDRSGALIAAPNPRATGALPAEAEAQLALPRLPDRPQIGYLSVPSAGAVSEVIAMPIVSNETGEIISALVLGFEPFEFSAKGAAVGMKSGIWLQGRLHAADMPSEVAQAIRANFERIFAATRQRGAPVRLEAAGAPYLVFAQPLNAGSAYPAAYEVCVYPLNGLAARRRELRWRVLGAGAALLLIGLAASHVISKRLSEPVEQLAVDSEANRTLRHRAEQALESTSAELQRSARFSADASHQLKTPVTVLRAGLEELLAKENLTPQECDEISALIHQTYRLSSLIEDLLLLSRMDAGRLKLELSAVNLGELIEASLDDLSALPDDLEVAVETDLPRELRIVGEKRYTAMILQNLLENARKYNRRGGRIRLAAALDGDLVRLVIANTGSPIPAAARVHVFERFHRAAIGENVPGYGLGLNLARELARLHRGDLRLVRSDEEWTEFEVSFQLAPAPGVAGRGVESMS